MDDQDKLNQEIEELKKMLENDLNGNKQGNDHKILKFLLSLILSFVICVICFVSLMGYFSNYISYKKSIYFIYYGLSLSGIYMVLSLLKPTYLKYFLFQPYMVFIINPIIMMIAMIIFNNIGQDYIVFDNVLTMVIYYLVADLVISSLRMMLYRIMFFRR